MTPAADNSPMLPRASAVGPAAPVPLVLDNSLFSFVISRFLIIYICLHLPTRLSALLEGTDPCSDPVSLSHWVFSPTLHSSFILSFHNHPATPIETLIDAELRITRNHPCSQESPCLRHPQVTANQHATMWLRQGRGQRRDNGVCKPGLGSPAQRK